MSRPSSRQRRDAAAFLDLRDLLEAREEFTAAWVADRRSDVPLRGTLNADSDFTFVSALNSRIAKLLEDEGLDEVRAEDVTSAVLSDPSFAVARSDKDDAHIRHAIAFSRDEAGLLPLELVVQLDARIRLRHVPEGQSSAVPSEVANAEITITVIDLENEAQLGDILRMFMAWLAEFPAPAPPARLRRNQIVFLGNPLALGTHGTPSEWRQDLAQLATLFGVDAEFQHGPDFDGSVSERTRHVVRLEPYRGSDPTAASGRLLPSTSINARDLDYQELFRQTAVALTQLTEERDIDPFGVRTLAAGERVYHRKVGNSMKFDRFDAGSTRPCQHGADSFVRFHGPKSRKGFARRYSNFQDSWMHHCNKYPNCNVYAVFAT